MGHGSHQWQGHVEAEVTDIDDPEELGRIKVNGRGLTADGADVELDVWIPPKQVVSYGLHLPPRVGDIVGIEFTSGDTSDTAHGETFLRNPDFKYTGVVRRDSGDVDQDFRGEQYTSRVGYKEPGASAGWAIDRKDDTAAFWGSTTYIGATGFEETLERAVGGAALAYWFEDFFTHLDVVINKIYDIVDYFRYWGDVTEPTQGWKVVGSIAKPDPVDTADIVAKLSELDTAWGKLVAMNNFVGGWQHDDVLLKVIEDSYEPGDGL